MGRRSLPFSREIRRRYSNAFKDFFLPGDGHFPFSCDVLFIDLLQIISPLCTRDDCFDPATGRAIAVFFSLVGQALSRIVRAVRPRTLLYLGYDGQGPCMKVEEQRRRTFDRLKRKADQKGSFLDNIPNTPESETERWKTVVQAAVDNRTWGDLDVIFDWELHPCEAEHKFAA
jgi:5'-3' exonuclease